MYTLSMKNLTGGAGKGYGLPLDVFADLHKKKKVIFVCENHLFLTQKRKASMSVSFYCGSQSDFLRFQYIPIYFPGHNMR